MMKRFGQVLALCSPKAVPRSRTPHAGRNRLTSQNQSSNQPRRRLHSGHQSFPEQPEDSFPPKLEISHSFIQPSGRSSGKTVVPEGKQKNVESEVAWTLGGACLQPAMLPASWHGGVQRIPSDGRKSGDVVVDRLCFKEVKQPGDGTCLFHSLCFGLADGTDGHSLRREISNHINDNPNMEIANLALKDWVKMECGRSIPSYAAKMAATGAFGGAIEMLVFSRLRGVNVHVYERCSGGYRRTCCFDDVALGARGTVNILYRKRCHYDALVFVGDPLQC